MKEVVFINGKPYTLKDGYYYPSTDDDLDYYDLHTRPGATPYQEATAQNRLKLEVKIERLLPF